MSGITGHEKPNQGATNDWLTPPEVIEALGPFDLDPCASVGQPWATAEQMYTPPDDGLALPWFGFVWCNPPYGAEAWTWLNRLAEHGEGIALVFARTETKGFFNEVWRKADAILFLEGRLRFRKPVTGEITGNAGGPSCLVAYGAEAMVRLHRSGLTGALVTGWNA